MVYTRSALLAAVAAAMSGAFAADTPNDGPYMMIANPHHNETEQQRIELHPAVQNIPLGPDDAASLRPPPPRVPASFDILVTIANYRDGRRCGYAVWTAFARAAHPDRVFVGVVDQTHGDDPRCVDEYCKLASESWPDEECKYKGHVQVDAVDAKDSKGPAVARARQRAFIDDQEFCMAIDAHTQFVFDWDTLVVKDWVRADNEMAILSVYPLGYDRVGPNFTAPTGSSNHLCVYGGRNAPDDIPIQWPMSIFNSAQPQMQAFWGGGMSFGKCHAELHVPIDGHLNWVFYGEEYIRAMQLWTHGYDLYSPSVHGSVLLHNYTNGKPKNCCSTSFFENADHNPAKPLEETRGYNRLRAALHFPFAGEVDFKDMDTYYGRPVRTVDAFLNFSKLSNTDPVKLDDWTCDQLHWVPYAVPEIVEAWLPGWRMRNATTTTAAGVAPSKTNTGATTSDFDTATADRLFAVLEDKLQELRDGDTSELELLQVTLDDVQKQLTASTEKKDMELQDLAAKLERLADRVDQSAKNATNENQWAAISSQLADTKAALLSEEVVKASSTLTQTDNLQAQFDAVAKQQHDAMVANVAVGGALMVLVVLGFVLTRPTKASQTYAPVEREPPTPHA
ncbi:Aste57867_2394 [Aphanomyces stellatus]|uniref:Aste57867_2394 protein n=1 Tax=Aphanomyces stellatus TaxID=120398 RepID=A0A485KBR5_9STRA|nr:hypothetical protein As57867_002388 [Aphanomyces stellatus]VFT79595.1 Aste57867_2394 [Aphanomyces stellatus]